MRTVRIESTLNSEECCFSWKACPLFYMHECWWQLGQFNMGGQCGRSGVAHFHIRILVFFCRNCGCSYWRHQANTELGMQVDPGTWSEWFVLSSPKFAGCKLCKWAKQYTLMHASLCHYLLCVAGGNDASSLNIVWVKNARQNLICNSIVNMCRCPAIDTLMDLQLP